MGEASLPDHCDGVNFLAAEDIRWTPRAPLPLPEDDDPIDVWALSHADLLAYTYSLHDDLRAARALAHTAVERVAAQTRQIRRQTDTIIALRAQMRAAA